MSALGELSASKQREALSREMLSNLNSSFADVPVHIEFQPGERRIIRNGAGEVVYDRVMRYPYGYIRGTKGRDGDEVDVVLGPTGLFRFIYVADMEDLGPDVKQRQDEDKVFLGFDSQADAEKAFESMYPKRWLRGIRPLDWPEFVKTYAFKPTF